MCEKGTAEATGVYTVYYNRRGVDHSDYPPCVGCGVDLGRRGRGRVSSPRDPVTGEYLRRIDCPCGAVNVLRYHDGGRVDRQ